MQTFRKALDWVIKLMRLVGAAAVAAMMFLVCADVIRRAAFGKPITGTEDAVGLLYLLLLGCALAVCHREGGHVGVDLVVQKLKPRTQAITDSITGLASLVLFVVTSREMWLFARELAIKGEVSMTVRIPLAPFVYVVSICFAVFCLALLSDLIDSVRKAVNG